MSRTTNETVGEGCDYTVTRAGGADGFSKYALQDLANINKLGCNLFVPHFHMIE